MKANTLRGLLGYIAVIACGYYLNSQGVSLGNILAIIGIGWGFWLTVPLKQFE